MAIEKNNDFHPQELLLLASAFGTKELFGLADTKVFQLQGVTFEEAYEKLREKGLFTKERKITKKAVVMIEVLKKYTESKKYIKFQNFTFAFFEKDYDKIMVLRENKKNESYSFIVADKTIIFRMFYEGLPVFSREPLDDEKTFFHEELTRKEISELKSLETMEAASFEFYHMRKSEDGNKREATLDKHVVFKDNNHLFTLDLPRKKILRTSQYMFWKKIFDEMDFPYGGAADVK